LPSKACFNAGLKVFRNRKIPKHSALVIYNRPFPTYKYTKTLYYSFALFCESTDIKGFVIL
jgi:hypothetical protein